jgi:membrane protein implicated in regulation of membrane protease activity
MDIWILIGVILLALEIFTTSFFLIFFGIAALVIALILFFVPLSVPFQITLFTALSILFFILGKKIIKKKRPHDDHLKDDIIDKVGEALQDCKEDSYLRVLVGDTIWNAKTQGPVKKGQKIQVIGIENLTLEVKPL